MGVYLGLDFGGTKLAAGLAAEDGRLLAFQRCPTDPNAGPEGALDAMRDLVAAFPAALLPPVAVGISFGGPVDSRRQRTVLSHHGPGWEAFPLVERVAHEWGVPAVMDNDANACALGEIRFGAGRGHRNLLYVTVSTGIGGGIILDGTLYRGSRGLSGEIGHTIVVPGGPLCPCGKRGCLEAVASGPAIARAYAAQATVGSTVVTAEEVFRLAAAGDIVARAVLDQAIEWLGVGLANAINLLDPDVVVVGGGVSRAGSALFDPLRAAVRSAAAPSPPGAVSVLPAALGDSGGVLGAVALALSSP